MDPIAAFFGHRTARRLVALGCFVGILYLFRHLALLLVFFVTFERSLGWATRVIAARWKIARKPALGLVVAGLLVIVAIVVWLGVGRTLRSAAAMQHDLPERLNHLRENPLVARIEAEIGGTERIVESAKHYAGNALTAASAVGHFVIHVLVGFVLAIVYVLEEEEIRAFGARLPPSSIQGMVVRWLGHVADATIVTVQLQVIVAACNTVVTLPVLIALGIPHVASLMVVIFVSALVPVIGNLVSGALLSVLAYQAKGWFGVGLFIGLTFVLHKVESYYLNPRLTARHVRLPAFVLIVSLIACEHLFGFKGLFLSFPILFVAGRIRAELAVPFEGENALEGHPPTSTASR